MRRLLVVLLMLGLAGSAMATTITGTNLGVKPAGDLTYTPPAEPRQGGDTVANCTPIGGLPYTDTGQTCGYVNNYDAICPYSGSASPDVVYCLTTGSAGGCINVDLCYSTYDTKVYVYEGAVGNLVACNDDFYFGAPCYVYSSFVGPVNLLPNTTYYIIVDGYGSACGSYQIDVTACVPIPPFDCPAGSRIENEPACQDNYQDHWNGGCNSTPTIWQACDGQAGGCAVMCGYSCTYSNAGVSTRDTDWFVSTALVGTLTETCIAEFPVQFILIYGASCSNLLYVLGTGGAGVPVTLSWYFATSVPMWTWVGPQSFSGVPNSQYKFEICNIAGGTPNPTETTTWGSLKNLYR